MSAYVYPNFPTKKALKEAVKRGDQVIAKENEPFGQKPITDGQATAEGPHFPQPHRWYATIVVQAGRVVKVS